MITQPKLTALYHDINYSYTIALSDLFELCTRGGRLNHEAKPSGLKAAPWVYNQINHDKAIV